MGIKQIIKIFIIVITLLSLAVAASAHGMHLSPLGSLAFRDFEWEIIPGDADSDADGYYYIKNVGDGSYFGERWSFIRDGGHFNLMTGGKFLSRADGGQRWDLSENNYGEQSKILFFHRDVNDKGHVLYVQTQEIISNGIYVIANPGYDDVFMGSLTSALDAGIIWLNDENPEVTPYIFYGELLDEDGTSWSLVPVETAGTIESDPDAMIAADSGQYQYHIHEDGEIHWDRDHTHGDTEIIEIAAVFVILMSGAAIYASLRKKKKLFELFSGLKMTIAGGVFLGVSLVFWLTDTNMPVILVADAAIPLDPAWAAVLICGYPLLYLAVRRIIYNKGMYKISSALLISIAMTASVFINQIFAAGQVAFIMAIGAILEDKTIERAKKGIKNLISLAPAQGRIIKDGKEELVQADHIKTGDVLRVLPGEAIPADGEIISGNTSIDQSIITGESLPIDKTAGDAVFCGTINRFGSVDIKAEKVGGDSSLQKLIRLVRDAENNKAPTQIIVDKWAVWLVPLTLVIAVITYLITRDIVRAVTIAIVFCPCALALATPTSIMAAIGQAARRGVIIKSGDALERMGKVDTIAFDKTGTLTHGNLAVSNIEGEDGILQIAASLERYSEHPVAKAIVAHYDGEYLDVRNFTATPGVGVEGDVGGRRVTIRRGGIITINGDYAGRVAVADKPRESGRATVAHLLGMGVGSVMLTGDDLQTAEAVAEQAGIKTVHAGLLPEQKTEKIREMQKSGRYVCMAGDGVNDAPALKTANVGVAMGSMGSDMAIEAADIALMGDDIEKIPYLKRLSNATVRLITFNICISMFFNVIFIVLSILGMLNPVTGALAHNIGSVLVVLNAALLYDRKYV
jgi:heavy metal-(Cd/Co/Hg/Pb/Zn)-translocating P-type ATPase